MPIPGSDHPITLEPATRRWRVYSQGHVIADSDEALILRETGLPPVVYFPREAVAMEYMGLTPRVTSCPYKGEAHYYTLTLDGEILENVAWTYEHPIDQMGPIGSRIAFYADRVEVYEVEDAAVNPHRDEQARDRLRAREQAAVRRDDLGVDIDEVVQHTDSGGGSSQREHWAPNVMPEQREGGVR